ncbi:MAG: hypothetical protein N2484_00175 [Clostridia bacterium]|nr:hypothetical protein [Clostridia bacterium]
MKPRKSCSNCIKGRPITVNNDILCREKGIVTPDYVCMRHRYMPQSKSTRNENSKCIDCENFIVEVFTSDNSSTIGLCQLFSVRQFDGTTKNACSKFVSRTYSDVS